MRLPGQAIRRDNPSELKMTSMIDVIFLLMIFFVTTAQFETIEQSLPTNLRLPGTSDQASPVDPALLDLDRIVVEIAWRDDGPAWRINHQDYASLADVGGVLNAVARVQADLIVILDADGDVPMEHLIDVYDLCRRIGLTRIQFAASDEAKP